MPQGENKGVLVSEVAPLGAIHGKLMEGDVITHIDGLDVTNEGDVPINAAGQKVFMISKASQRTMNFSQISKLVNK